MADYFLGALKQIERRAQNNILIFSDVLTERLEIIATNMVNHKMSDNDYLKLFEMFYKKFSKDENEKAMLFCLLRMQEVDALKKNPKKQKEIQNMEFNMTYDVLTETFLKRKRSYYKRRMNQNFIKFILFDTLGYIILLNVFVLLFHFSFKIMMSLLFLMWLIMIYYANTQGKYRLYKRQMDMLSKYVDPILLKVDATVFKKAESKKNFC